jgi:DNA-binding MarR family transcriptional regulator
MAMPTHDVAELFLRVVPQVMRVVAADVRKSGLEIEPFYVHLLGFLAQGDRSLGDLADVLAVSAPTMSKTVSTLEGRRWVRRQRSIRDGRVVRVVLTAEGRAVLERAQAYMVGRIAEALAVLSPEDCARLASGLEILGEVLANPSAVPEPGLAP